MLRIEKASIMLIDRIGKRMGVHTRPKSGREGKGKVTSKRESRRDRQMRKGM
jgi:hypothetical protein